MFNQNIDEFIVTIFRKNVSKLSEAFTLNVQF